MELIINSVLARVQRNNKVILHHYIFEGSHVHIICTAKDAYQCQAFYGEVQKQLTDSIKRLLGLKHLTIWEGRAKVIRIPTLEDAVEKIAYLYANPSNDGLESSIEDYPGVSSWKGHLAINTLSNPYTTESAWVRQFMIPRLPRRSVSSQEDKQVTEAMRSRVKTFHVLELYPHLWIEHFIKNPSYEDVKAVKADILKDLRRRERENAEERKATGKKVLGERALRREPLLKSHTPKKQDRSIFVHSKFKEIRIEIIAEMKRIDSLCREVYKKWKLGDYRAVWPPGTFPPPLPPRANALCY
jgi:hypothetical protein